MASRKKAAAAEVKVDGPRYLGSARFAELCREAGLSSDQVRAITHWPPEHHARVMAGAMPFIGGYFGEIRRLAPLLGVTMNELWALYDMDRANWKSKRAEDSGRPSEKR